MAEVTINGRAHEVEPEMTYEQLVEAAGAHPEASITYSHKHVDEYGEHRHTGTVTAGQNLRMADGMMLSVVFTGNA